MYRGMNCILALLVCLPTLTLASSSTTSGVSNAMNPALSVNALSRAMYSRDSDSMELNGFGLEEAEMHFSSVVDPFWKANVILSMYPVDSGSSYAVNVEEANIAGTSLPAGLALKLGKFFVPFGKHSPLHTHQFPFASAPLTASVFLGSGLTESGVEMIYSLPTSWFSDVIVYGISGDTEIFDNTDRDVALGGRWLNLLDASDNATLEFGASLLNGPASEFHFGRPGNFSVYGFDLTYKWVSSTSSHGPAFTMMSEVLVPDLGDGAGDPVGWYTLAQYRCHHNWWLGIEHGYIDCGNGSGTNSTFNGEFKEYQLNATFAPSEFSALRAGVAYYQDQIADDDDLQFSVQWNFTIGSHPAHLY